MCGIAGLAGKVEAGRLEAAASQLFHRGPDDAGRFVSEAAALVVRRLSIIDLEGGHQPLANEDGTVWVAYNGEIFNAPALRRQLEGLGHRFQTHTDTEILVHAYEQWGDTCVTHLRGMFAFGVWDSPRERLLLARDRHGIKPLYYAQLGSRLAFASEVRPLLTLLPELSPRLSRTALAKLLAVGFIPSPLTAFEGIFKLPAAHSLSFTKGQLELQPYWSLNYPAQGAHAPAPLDAAAAEFTLRLAEAVDAWRMSDVPVGSLLSGGVDSAALAALLTEASGAPINTFTIGFTAASHDESAQARETARAIGSHHHELTFTPAHFDSLPAVIRHLEEPQSSATSVPIYLLYRACHEAGYKVILTGEGADELLGGYHWFDGDRRMRPLLALPRVVRQALAMLPVQASTSARRVLRQGNRDDAERYWLWQQVASPAELRALLPNVHPNGRGAAPPGNGAGQNLHPLDQFLKLESEARMVDFINFEVDRMSMASSVEARPPFLDHHLWEYCAGLPPECKLSPNGNKLLLRRGLAGRLPEPVLNQPKRGLAAPHAQWLRGPLPAWAEEALHGAALAEAGYFVPAEVARLRTRHAGGQADHARLLMGVLTTQLWHQEFAG